MSLITDLNALMKPEAVEKERIRIKSEIDALQHQLDTLDHLIGNRSQSPAPTSIPTSRRDNNGGRREVIRQLLTKTPRLRVSQVARAIGVITPAAYTCMKNNPSTFKKLGKLWYLADS